MKQLVLEVDTKVKKGRCRVVLWDDIKDNPLPELKVSRSPRSLTNHVFFEPVLDISFAICLASGMQDNLKRAAKILDQPDKRASQSTADAQIKRSKASCT